LHQSLVGELIQDEHGQMFFTYTESWLANQNAIPLSHSLPLRNETFKSNECRTFFAGILPEEEKRDIIARILGISPRNDFAMLERIGGECAGALTFLPVNETPSDENYQYRSLSKQELADILRILPKRPLMAGDEGIRLSLAGIQDKLAVMIKNHEIFIPLGSAPSTHILKPAIARFEGVVYNEALCLKLADAVGIPVAKSSIDSIDDIDYLLIERYDRIVDDKGYIHRIHQEDFCQALSISPDMKYQNEGGPSLKQCFDLIRAVSSVPVVDLKNLLDVVIFNVIIGNADAHGKNFSLLYRNHHVTLSPFYDLVCTTFYPELSHHMAMKIGDNYGLDKLSMHHFEQLAGQIGFAVPMVKKRVQQLANEITNAAYNFPAENKTSRDILKIIHERSVALLD
jgi:serine/threonine-protein kinase HipA